MKLTDKELNKLLSDHTPEQIISMYTHLKIDLYSKHINKLIKLRNRRLNDKNKQAAS